MCRTVQRRTFPLGDTFDRKPAKGKGSRCETELNGQRILFRMGCTAGAEGARCRTLACQQPTDPCRCPIPAVRCARVYLHQPAHTHGMQGRQAQQQHQQRASGHRHCTLVGRRQAWHRRNQPRQCREAVRASIARGGKWATLPVIAMIIKSATAAGCALPVPYHPRDTRWRCPGPHRCGAPAPLQAYGNSWRGRKGLSRRTRPCPGGGPGGSRRTGPGGQRVGRQNQQRQRTDRGHRVSDEDRESADDFMATRPPTSPAGWQRSARRRMPR